MRKRKQKAIVDFAGSYLILPMIEFNALIHQTSAKLDEGEQRYILPCNGYKNLPNLTFTIGGNNFDVPSSDYMIDVSFYVLVKFQLFY